MTSKELKAEIVKKVDLRKTIALKVLDLAVQIQECRKNRSNLSLDIKNLVKKYRTDRVSEKAQRDAEAKKIRALRVAEKAKKLEAKKASEIAKPSTPAEAQQTAAAIVARVVAKVGL